MDHSSQHYLGNRGCAYFAGRFGDAQELGRIYQSRYFTPYCSPTARLLDFGCGDGTMLRQLPAAIRIGVEVNPECHRHIEKMNERLNSPIIVYDRIDQVADQSVDVVISNHCLEHVPCPLHSLQEVRRVLVKGGRLALVVPFDDWRAPDNRKWTPEDQDNHLYTWSPQNLGNLLVEAGFHVDKVELHSFAWSPKIFWVYKRLGNAAFRMACRILSIARQRREILCIART